MNRQIVLNNIFDSNYRFTNTEYAQVATYLDTDVYAVMKILRSNNTISHIRLLTEICDHNQKLRNNLLKILTNKVYYVSKNLIVSILKEDLDEDYYTTILNRCKYYIDKYFRYIDNYDIACVGVNDNILKYYLKIHSNEINILDWRGVSIVIFKLLIKIKSLKSTDILVDENRELPRFGIDQIIILSQQIQFHFYYCQNTSAFYVGDKLIVAKILYIQYFRLLVRKRATLKNRIKLLSGNLMELLINKLLLIFINKSTGKSILYFV